jgi:hypothetical protein
MAITSEQILISLDDLDCQMEAFMREQRDEEYATRINERLAAIKYVYPDSPCEYNEPRPKMGGWFPAIVLGITAWGGMALLVRWLI